MATKKNRNSKNKEARKKIPPVPEKRDFTGHEPEPKDDASEKKPFDYGGIPDRDLKKNLGCG